MFSSPSVTEAKEIVREKKNHSKALSEIMWRLAVRKPKFFITFSLFNTNFLLLIFSFTKKKSELIL